MEKIHAKPILAISNRSKTIHYENEYPMPYHYDDWGIWDRMKHSIMRVEDVNCLRAIDAAIEKEKQEKNGLS
jgi:hypothetical protein